MTELWPHLGLSLEIALAATALLAIVVVPLALFMARRRFIGKSIVETLILLPLVMPPTVTGFFILEMMGRRGAMGRLLSLFNIEIIFSVNGAILAAAVVALPVMYIPVKAAFASIEPELEDVARLMGASRLQTFWHISLPLARRGLFSGMLLAFGRAIGEFGATAMVLGLGNRQTLPISIWMDWLDGERSHSIPVVIALTLICFTLMMTYNLSASRE